MMRTALFVLALTVGVCLGVPHHKTGRIPHASPSPREVHETISPGNGLDRGSWGDVDLCPTDSVVKSFELKYAELGNLDDTAGNGLKLYCEDPQGGLTYVNSAEATYGDWQGIRSCSDRTVTLVGVRLEVLGDQGDFGDDLGVTNVQMFCNGTFEQLDGRYGHLSEEDAPVHVQPRLLNVATKEEVLLEDGRKVEKIRANLPQLRESPSYGSWVQCSPGYSICGLQTRVEPDHTFDDDAGLVDVQFFCC